MKMLSTKEEILRLIMQLDRITKGFEEERNLKNEAYYFIISKGLLPQYRDFVSTYRTEDRNPHQDCLTALAEGGAGQQYG